MTVRNIPLTTESSLPTIPPLEPSDCLTRDEFERRYQAMPGLKKAELIEGVVHMPSPVRWDHHAQPHAHLIWWLVNYSLRTPGVGVGDNASVRLDAKNEPQPDATMIILPGAVGQARKTSDDYVEGAPELVAEIAASSASIDLNAKFRVYRRNQVQEYLVWRMEDQAIDWFELREGQYEPIAADSAGVLKSRVFPGLWLAGKALAAGDLTSVHEVLEQGLRSVEHREFIARLAQSAK